MKLKESCPRKSVTECGPEYSHQEEQKIEKTSVLLTVGVIGFEYTEFLCSTYVSLVKLHF